MKNQQTDLANDVTTWLMKYMMCLYASLFAIHLFASSHHQEPEQLKVPFESGNIYMSNINCVA